jgi:hypothetical protein
MGTVTLLAALAAEHAAACGGFACNQAQPVVQDAETVVFGVDEAAEVVEMHVQVSYAGPAADFGWIVPVPADPDLFVSTPDLFAQLRSATAPQHVLTATVDGHCREPFEPERMFPELKDYEMAPGDAVASAPGVSVVDSAPVGPYDTVTLQARSEADLLEWLEEHDYDIPDGIDGALAPYIAEDAYFVALRLQKGQDLGDLAPLGLRYAGTRAMIPVQLTSISASPDMPLVVNVLSSARAVPESYLHVQINDAAVDWWQGGDNYRDVVSEAADEAGGHAFVTDYHGPSGVVPTLFDEGGFDEAVLRQSTSFWAFVQDARAQLPATADVQGFLSGELMVLVGRDFDADVATDLVLERLVAPLKQAQALLDRPLLTRMTSSLDAAEMTVDPVFVLNRDMVGPVRARRDATYTWRCGNGRSSEKAPRSLTLADGRAIEIPSEGWFRDNGGTEFEYIAELGRTRAKIIERTGAHGQPEVLVDHTAALFDQVRAHNQALDRGLVCDGTGGAGAAGGGLAVGLVAALGRRRTAAARRWLR